MSNILSSVNPLRKADYCRVEIYTRMAKVFKISMPQAHGQQLKTSVETVYGKPMPYETAMVVTISEVKEKFKIAFLTNVTKYIDNYIQYFELGERKQNQICFNICQLLKWKCILDQNT